MHKNMPKKKIGKDLGFILGFRIRWNNILNILRRFYNFSMRIRKAAVYTASEIELIEKQ